MIKRLMKDNLPCAMLKGIPISEADAKKYLGLTDTTLHANKEDFRLACMHTASANSVSVIGASHYPKTTFPWYDSSGNEITFPETEVAYGKNYSKIEGTSYKEYFPSRGNNFYWDDKRTYEYASALLEKTRVAYSIPDEYEIVPPNTPYVTQHNFANIGNATQAYDTMSFKTPLQSFYSAQPVTEANLIKNWWTDEMIIGNGNGGIDVSTYYTNGMSQGGDGAAGCKLIIKHSNAVKMGIECIISAEGLDTYLNTSRNSQTYTGVDGIFNIVTKGLQGCSPVTNYNCSWGISKFYDMKTDCKKIAPNTYYLNDDDYYTIQNSDNYGGTSAYIHATMFANGMPHYQVNKKRWVIKRSYKSDPQRPGYYLGASGGGSYGDPDKDVWGSPFGIHTSTKSYYPLYFTDSADAQNFITNALSQYYPLPTGDSIEPEYTYSQIQSESAWNPWRAIGAPDFPDEAKIIALNYHFTAV